MSKGSFHHFSPMLFLAFSRKCLFFRQWQNMSGHHSTVRLLILCLVFALFKLCSNNAFFLNQRFLRSLLLQKQSIMVDLSGETGLLPPIQNTVYLFRVVNEEAFQSTIGLCCRPSELWNETKIFVWFLFQQLLICFTEHLQETKCSAKCHHVVLLKSPCN